MENKLKELIGLEVKESNSGGSAGSILVIGLENEIYFYIVCMWRISKNEKVLVTSSDSFEFPNGLIIKESGKYSGKVIDFSLSQFYDLTLTLDTGYKLEIFCDIGHSLDEYPLNWELNFPQENLSLKINNHFQLLQSKYDEEENKDEFKPSFDLLDDLN
ncbi:MAG: hypothetical protein L0I93_08200 [Atopostipes suicloacalis]|nr:hypothetical protein [Lactococcus plantarum]MDN6084042.1 hypothetical protein [Lactococcus plantarum]MDN6196456.1 hypothetical protein [Atopostipes suicloacalis]